MQFVVFDEPQNGCCGNFFQLWLKNTPSNKPYYWPEVECFVRAGDVADASTRHSRGLCHLNRNRTQCPRVCSGSLQTHWSGDCVSRAA